MSLYEILYLISKKSGSFNPHIEETIRRINPKARIYTTKTQKDVTLQSVAFSKETKGNGIIYVAGGDGAVNEVVNAIYPTGCAFGVFPYGTGNDFARHIYQGIFPSIEQLVYRSLHPSLRTIDLLQINDRLGVNISSFGLDSIISDYGKEIALKYPHFKKYSYYLSALKHLAIPYEHEFTLTVDGVPQKIDWKGLLFVIGNGSSYGSGFQVLPTAEIDDGWMNILSIERVSVFKILSLFLKFFHGKHLSERIIHHYKAKEVELTFQKEEPGNIDGEAHPARLVKASILPNTIRLADLTKTASE